MWASDLFHATFFFVALAMGELVSKKTNGIIISVLTVCTIYTIGYFSGFVPRDTMDHIGFSKVLASFGLMMVITNLGTMVELHKFMQEWRTVLICVVSLLFLGLVLVLLGSAVFGREYALVAYMPLAGGSVSTAMASEAALAAGRDELSAFAWVVGILQFFVGLPTASVLIRAYCKKVLKDGGLSGETKQKETVENDTSIKKIFTIPAKYNTNYMIMAKLMFITQLAIWVGGKIHFSGPVLCLIFGVIISELGLPDRHSQRTCGAFVGKLLHYDIRLSAALGLAAMYGFPHTVTIPDQVVSALQLPKETSEQLLDTIIPKMVIAGFASVTICSVAIAGIICPLIF